MPKSRKRARAATPAKTTSDSGISRRAVLGGGAAATTLVLGGGFWGVSSFRSYAAEHDLTRVGQGALSIVQIHDPQCQSCIALQKQARRALRDFDDCGLTFLIADVKTPDGAAFARRYNVSNVTLLLFDGAGELKQTLHGLRQSAQLAEHFAAHKASLA